MVQGSMSCVKYLMFIFNFILVLCGIAIIAVGGYAFKYDFTEFFGSKFATAPVLLIVLGVIIFVIAFLGCCGAIKENYCMVMTFGLLMFILFIATIAGGITGFVYRKDLENFSETLLRKAMIESLKQQKSGSIKIWDDMQSELHCCGVDSFDDYPYNGVLTPSSCCKKMIKGACLPYPDGCLKRVMGETKKNFALVGGFGIAVAVIELLGCIFAWCLASAIKRDNGDNAYNNI